jgi:hypothetical protein
MPSGDDGAQSSHRGDKRYISAAPEAFHLAAVIPPNGLRADAWKQGKLVWQPVKPSAPGYWHMHHAAFSSSLRPAAEW